MKIIKTLQEALELKEAGKLIGQFSMPNDVYHSHELGAVNNSSFEHLGKSPAHYQMWINETSKKSDSMKFGTLVHELLLEPDLFKDKYSFIPKIDKRTKEGKAKYNELLELSEGKILVEEDVYNSVKKSVEAFKNHPWFKVLLSDGIAEQSFFWKDKETGVLCKIRADYYIPSLNLVVDIKTTLDATDFGRSSAKYGYHTQNAFYIDGLREVTGVEPDFIFFIVESSEPFGVKLVRLDNDSQDLGRNKYRELLSVYAKCLETGDWTGYKHEIETIRLPSWAFDK